MLLIKYVWYSVKTQKRATSQAVGYHYFYFYFHSVPFVF
jgi:hypothetical protein